MLGSKHLPSLKLNEERVLFSTNAAASYLLPPSVDVEEASVEWMEWEASVLKPAVAACALNATKTGCQSNLVTPCLQKLDRQLSGHGAILGVRI